MSEEIDHLQDGLKPGEVRLHNRFHPTRWKKGFASYFFHTPMEYEILQKGQDSDITRDPPWAPGTLRYNHRHILIRPLTIGQTKSKSFSVSFPSGKFFNVNDISDYQFWIDRKFIRRGPNSWSQKKHRHVMKVVFEHCMRRAINGKTDWRNPFMWPFSMKDPTKITYDAERVV